MATKRCTAGRYTVLPDRTSAVELDAMPLQWLCQGQEFASLRALHLSEMQPGLDRPSEFATVAP